MGVEMRREVALDARRVQAGSAPDTHQSSGNSSGRWLQLAGEIRRLDLATEKIMRFLENDLRVFVRACNARY
jgi:hypothetical protein